MTLREKLLAVKHRIVPVPIADLDTFYIRSMSGAERDSYEAGQYLINATAKTVEVNRDNARARLLARTLVDADGNRLFKDDEVDTLGQVPAKVLDQLFSVALKVNGFSKDDLDELTKN